MEFLGLLLSNLDGNPFISLTRGRRDALLGELRRWREWAAGERREGRAPRPLPRELASMLGKLVFASQTVVNGRPFMQSMLSSFQGCEVDWRRGQVSFRGGANTARMSLPEGFWADVDWWLDHLQTRYSTPYRRSSTGLWRLCWALTRAAGARGSWHG